MSWLRKKIAELANTDRIAGLIDQGMQSSIQLLALLLFARWLSKDEFGVFALAIALSYTAAGLQRAMITLPFIISCPTPEIVKQKGGHWFWLNLLLILATAITLALVYLAVLALGSPAWLSDSIGYATISVAPIMLYDFTRRWLYQSKKHRTILSMSAVNFGSYVMILIVIYFTTREVWTAVLAQAVANTLGAVTARIGDRPPGLRAARGMFAAWRGMRSFTLWQLLGSFVSQSDNRGIKLVVGALAGPAGVAILATTSNLTRPVGAITSAVDMIDKPRAGRAYARAGLPGLHRSIRGTQRLLLLLGSPYLLLVMLFSSEVMGLVYGDKYAGYATELRLWMIAALIGLLNRPLETKMIMLQQSRPLFYCKLGSGLVTYSMLAVLIGPYGITGAIVGVLVGKVAKQIMLMIASRVAAKQPLPAMATPSKPPPEATAEQDNVPPDARAEPAPSR